ncbi:uncharacterized protein PAC_10757 [Phialocephala subalpina]|uniref:Ku C-terminal domain-containing protein n=1 Tax=Phialocephala subalpina TaxID=576137 RepID=A0A1L7X769_9HELO|nr:uncharacterized protein PAC_10757 [Phialocephala subalpina]
MWRPMNGVLQLREAEDPSKSFTISLKVADSDKAVDDAVERLGSCIREEIKSMGGDTLSYISRIQLMRKSMIDYEMSHPYNRFIRQLKESLQSDELGFCKVDDNMLDGANVADEDRGITIHESANHVLDLLALPPTPFEALWYPARSSHWQCYKCMAMDSDDCKCDGELDLTPENLAQFSKAWKDSLPNYINEFQATLDLQHLDLALLDPISTLNQKIQEDCSSEGKSCVSIVDTSLKMYDAFLREHKLPRLPGIWLGTRTLFWRRLWVNDTDDEPRMQHKSASDVVVISSSTLGVP